MNYSSISRHRAVLMGLAIIGIILFHVPLSRGDMFFGLKRMGNVGVDVFFLLSGVGLWFAWSKKPSVMHFYRRRLLRIMPAWMVVATAFYLTDWLGAQRFSSSLVDLIGDITINWDFWLHDELTFWYIPATLALYLVAPWYMRLIASRPAYRWLPVLMVVWCVAVYLSGASAARTLPALLGTYGLYPHDAVGTDAAGAVDRAVAATVALGYRLGGCHQSGDLPYPLPVCASTYQ